jgi:TPR repeat protein
MCGAKLPSRRRVEREREEAQAFSRPSLLGLAEVDPTEAERIDYLLEDERGTQHGGRWVALILLAAVVAGLGWHWRTEIRGWTSKTAKNPDVTQVADTSTAQPVTALPETVVTPTSSGAQQTPANDSVAQSAAAPAPSDQAGTQPVQGVSDATTREAEPREEQVPVAKKPALKPAARKTTYKAAAKNESAEVLEAQGEDYLYGRGVQADCGRAGKSLLAAARSSAKAQSVLGTMYATGHCVTRDVPAAYRWFAKTSHQEPGNVRIQRDLQVLWQQMTPEEREVAMKKEP